MTTIQRYARMSFVPVFCLLLCSLLRSQINNKNSTATAKTITGAGSLSPTPTGPAAPQALFKVTINASRVSVTRDGSYGVYADLENLSPDVVKIRPQETMLVVQPEVSQPIACVGLEPGIFPAQPAANNQAKGAEMLIQPSEHYKVFWNLTSPEKPSGTRCSGSSWLREYLGFVPGEYAFTVEGIVYAPNSSGESVAHTYTETTTLHVGISQISTAIAAFLGALLAYFVVALEPGQDFDQWKPKAPAASSLQTAGGWLKIVGVVVRNALAAGLLGSALTIVASRLSDTQFPIKVSVNDFWGALTIGFVSYFIGNRLITMITAKFAPPPKNQPGGAPDAGSPQVGNPAMGNPSAGNNPADNPDQPVNIEEDSLTERLKYSNNKLNRGEY